MFIRSRYTVCKKVVDESRTYYQYNEFVRLKSTQSTSAKNHQSFKKELNSVSDAQIVKSKKALRNTKDESKILDAALAKSKVLTEETTDDNKFLMEIGDFVDKSLKLQSSSKEHKKNIGSTIHMNNKNGFPKKRKTDANAPLVNSKSSSSPQSFKKHESTPPDYIKQLQENVLDMKPHKAKKFTNLNIQLKTSKDFELEHIEQKDATLPPTLKHGIDYALFQPLSFQLTKDKRSGKKCIGEFVSTPINVKDFNYNALPKYKTPSEDKKLFEVAQKSGAKFYSSSSAMTGILSQLHFFLSNFRPVKHHFLSKTFENYSDFAMSAKQAVSLLVQRQNSQEPIYSISNDKSADIDMILSQLGHALETQLTTTPETFNKIFNKSHPDFVGHKQTKNPQESSVDNKEDEQNYFHYSKISNFVLRSQLDSHHKDLPGSGVFDLKTRAVTAIRNDLAHVQNNNNYTGYKLNNVFGAYQSFEREFYELSRLTLLKYGLQAQIGNMDGIFMAYHNISEIFGFQYLPLDDIKYILSSYHDEKFRNALKRRAEIMKLLYSPKELVMNDLLYKDTMEKKVASSIMDQEYKFSFQILNKMLDIIHQDLNHCSDFRLIVKTESAFVPKANEDATVEDTDKIPSKKKSTLYFFAVPLENEDVRFLEDRNLKNTLLNDDPHANEKIDEYLKDLDHFNKTHFNNKLHAYKVTITNHSVVGDKSVKLPAVDLTNMKTKSGSSDEKLKLNNLEKTKLKKFIQGEFAYKYLNEWDHPSFFHPDDVSNWKVDCKITKINSPMTKTKMYSNYLDEKLRLLKTQIRERRESDFGTGSYDTSDQSTNCASLVFSDKLKYLLNTPVLPKYYKSVRPSYDIVRETLRAFGEKP